MSSQADESIVFARDYSYSSEEDEEVDKVTKKVKVCHSEHQEARSSSVEHILQKMEERILLKATNTHDSLTSVNKQFKELEDKLTNLDRRLFSWL